MIQNSLYNMTLSYNYDINYKNIMCLGAVGYDSDSTENLRVCRPCRPFRLGLDSEQNSESEIRPFRLGLGPKQRGKEGRTGKPGRARARTLKNVHTHAGARAHAHRGTRSHAHVAGTHTGPTARADNSAPFVNDGDDGHRDGHGYDHATLRPGPGRPPGRL
jgi:hypothetical protein